MKKLVLLISTVIFILCIIRGTFANELLQKIDVEINKISLQVNGSNINMNNLLYNGTTYVPLRAIAEKLGLTVKWDEISSTANLTNSQPEIQSFSLLDGNEWIETSPPLIDKESSDPNYYKDEWKVEITDGIKVRANDRQPFVQLITNNGFFIGTDRGEWGGHLYFQPYNTEEKSVKMQDGSMEKGDYLQDSYKVMDGNIIGLYKINNNIYVVEGFSGFSMNSGSIYKLSNIENRDDKYEAQKIIDLEDTPYAFTIMNNIVYMVTRHELIKIENEKVTETIIDNAFWQHLIPNSLVYMNDSLYIGMTKGVAKVDLSTRDIRWYTKK